MPRPETTGPQLTNWSREDAAGKAFFDSIGRTHVTCSSPAAGVHVSIVHAIYFVFVFVLAAEPPGFGHHPIPQPFRAPEKSDRERQETNIQEYRIGRGGRSQLPSRVQLRIKQKRDWRKSVAQWLGHSDEDSRCYMGESPCNTIAQLCQLGNCAKL